MPPTVAGVKYLGIAFACHLLFKKTRRSTFLDNDQVQNTEIGIDDAAADRLALALASPAGTVAGVSLAKQQAHATVGQHTLLHGETLLVVASADAHHVSLEKRKVHH